MDVIRDPFVVWARIGLAWGGRSNKQLPQHAARYTGPVRGLARCTGAVPNS